MSNLNSLKLIEIGQKCFAGHYDEKHHYYSGGASSISLIGNNGKVKRRIDLPQLQSVRIGNDAFTVAKYFELSNLTSIESIEIGSGCFSGYYHQQNRQWIYTAISFSLNGKKE